MSQFDEKVNFMKEEAARLGWSVDTELLTKVAKGLGPSIYNEDSSTVASSDKDEISRVKDNFLKGKLGCTDEAAMDQAIAEVIEAFGSSNRNKYRILFYYLLAEKLGKQSAYND